MLFANLTVTHCQENTIYPGQEDRVKPAASGETPTPEEVYEVRLDDDVIGKILVLADTVVAFTVDVEWDIHMPYAVERPLGKPVPHGQDDRKKFAAILAFSKRISSKCFVCTQCKDICMPGHMFDREVCQGCATQLWGVIF